MRIFWRPKVNIIGGLFILLMVRASYWQWERHQEKIKFLASLDQRIEAPVVDLTAAASQYSPQLNPRTTSAANSRNTNLQFIDIPYRRVQISGRYDFSHEMILRNRKGALGPGVHVLTPLLLDGGGAVIVSRGYLPLAQALPEKRKKYQQPEWISFVGLAKESVPERLLAPRDPPTGLNLPWADQWLRVNIPAIQKQIPYELLPFYVEIAASPDPEFIRAKLAESKSDRDEMMLPTSIEKHVGVPITNALEGYPLPSLEPYVPPVRHLGYVYEWALMAILTAGICVVLQLRPYRPLPPL